MRTTLDRAARAARERPLAAGAVAVMAALLLSACLHEPYVSGGVIVEAPPAPLVETIGVAPFVGAVWVDGYWRWTGSRYLWVRGRWARPRDGMRWHRGGYVRADGGYRYVPGRWAPRGYRSPHRYVHPRRSVRYRRQAPARRELRRRDGDRREPRRRDRDRRERRR